MKTKLVYLLVALIPVSAFACKKADLSTDKGKYSYAIGYNIGSSLKHDGVEIDTDSFIAALEDALKGKESSLSPEDAQQAIMNLRISMQTKRAQSAEENKKKGEDYLTANKTKDGVKSTATGLQYRVLKEGNGAKPKSDDFVTVHYSGKLIDGSEFDSSYKRNDPAKFKLDSVISGWTEGLQLMSVGSKFEFVIPSELGYGPMGNQAIPGNSVLIFEVELLGIGK